MMAEEEKFSIQSDSVNMPTPKISSTLVDIKHQEYENSEYFSISRLLEKTYFHHRGFIMRLFRRKSNLFTRPGSNSLSPFENILLSNEDKSATISLILRMFNLWSNEIFWTKTVNLKDVMNYFAVNKNANIKNLFSILLYDWHSPNGETTPKTTHVLCEKFEAFEASGRSLFSKLFETVDDELHRGYGHVCLRIIYHYLHEKKAKLTDIGNYYERSLFQNEVMSAIKGAISIKNEDFKMKVLKILTVFMDNTNDEDYRDLKEKILDIVRYNFETDSVYRVQYDAVVGHCDEKFFHLAFLLKEYRLKKFEFEFDDFNRIYKQFYGEYWSVAIKENARLLYHICEDQCETKLLKTVEYIFQKCPFIELNSTILTTFDEVAEFYTIFNEPLDQKEEDYLNECQEFLEQHFISDDEFFEKCILNKTLTRKLLIGRRSVNHESLLEKILAQPRLCELIDYVWNTFHLYEKPELLTLKNPMGKSLISYACKAGVEQIVIFLLLPRTHSLDHFSKRKYFTILQNTQVYSITGKSIMEHQIDIFLNEGAECDIFSVIIYLLEEIGIIKDMPNDEIVNGFLSIAAQTNVYSHELFEIDDLLGIMITYWTPSNGEYSRYKKCLIDYNPFFDLLFMIIEKRYEDFINTFPSKFEELEECYEQRYDVSVTQKNSYDNQHERYSSNFLFILFLAAIRTNQKKIIDFIFKNDSFVTINFAFPENVRPSEVHYYAALNMLKHGHELGRANIPADWLTKEVLEEFLDTRITYRDQEFIQIDCTSLLHAETQKTIVKNRNDLSDKLLMLEDTMALNYIKEHENLKCLMTHPVVETYINLKTFKYQRISICNFWAFVVLYILPFMSLIYHNHKEDEDSFWSGLVLNNKWHYLGILFLVLRESFQCMVSGSFIAYIRQRSNIFDMALIMLSIVLSICSTAKISSFKWGDSNISILSFLEVGLILFTTICATSLLPLSYVPINMQILKKVSMTFLKIFYTFAIILIAFSFSFCIMFEDNFKKSNQTAETNSSNEEKDDEKDDLDSFKNPHTSFMKIVIMLSGEYSIDPAILTQVQLAFFGFFVVASFILFNLILGLSIEDVQELKAGSRQFNLATKAKKLIIFGEKLAIFFNYVNEYKTSYSQFDTGKLRVFKDFILETTLVIVRFALSKFIYVHSIQKVYVNLKTRKVFININRKYEPVLTTVMFNRKKDYKVDDTMLHKIQKIINVKNEKMFKSLKQKMRMDEMKQHMD